jgi:hypothetical protein
MEHCLDENAVNGSPAPSRATLREFKALAKYL